MWDLIIENKWNILLFGGVWVLVVICSIKAYFSGRKDRFEGKEEEIESGYDYEDNWIDWDKIS